MTLHSDMATPGLSASLPRAPEEHVLFRLAQLLMLLDEVEPDGPDGVGVERLGYYDFFAANPFAVFGVEDLLERAQLHSAGFDERQLSYASTGARFANRRQRLQHDVALLIAYGLVKPGSRGYLISDAGRSAARNLHSLYASQYRSAARLVHRRFRPLSDTALSQNARDWLRSPSLLLDLYGSPELEDEPLSGPPDVPSWGAEQATFTDAMPTESSATVAETDPRRPERWDD